MANTVLCLALVLLTVCHSGCWNAKPGLDICALSGYPNEGFAFGRVYYEVDLSAETSYMKPVGIGGIGIELVGSSPTVSVSTDNHGCYAVPVDSPGLYIISMSTEAGPLGGGRVMVSEELQGRRDFRLPTLGALAGMLDAGVDANAGDRIELHGEKASLPTFFDAKTLGSDGSFWFDNLPPGAYRVFLSNTDSDPKPRELACQTGTLRAKVLIPLGFEVKALRNCRVSGDR